MERKGHIIWIDDEIDHLKPHILFLEAKGYKITTATNGSDANILNQENRFDLALLDQNMPGIDGIDTLKKIKSHRQTIPVIMITKSEDEWLMDEAISQQINQFLIKPVSPNQIYMACKQILEKNKIIEDKTMSEYLQDFQRINQDINIIESLDEWWQLFLSLVNWQIKFDKQVDSSLNNILIDQTNECNKQFSKYIEDNYETLVKDNKSPILSPSVFKNHAQPSLDNGKKVCFIVIDCMRCDQFLSIYPYLESLFQVEMSYHLSLLPSATSFSRNAIFSGLFPDQMLKKYPKQKDSFLNNENGLNKYEEEYLNDQIRRLGNDNKKVHYHKIWALEEGKRFSKKINNYLEKDVIALVVNFVDMLAHDSSKMDVLKELIPDESGYRKTVRSWVENSWFNDVLKVLSQSNFDVVITSDHGSIKVNKEIMVSADKDASDGVRYKYGRNLNSKNKNVMKINNPENFKLPTFGPQFNYLLAKNDSYFLYPNEANRYKNKLQNSFQHGGISLEEMLIPVLKMKGISK
ncbi:MAG: bifunctional response regulator/alkaline phosphatase family protein [bacterium]